MRFSLLSLFAPLMLAMPAMPQPLPLVPHGSPGRVSQHARGPSKLGRRLRRKHELGRAGSF